MHRLLRTKRFFLPHEAKVVVKCVLGALAYLHDEMDVCHRDVKLENLLLANGTDLASVKLSDFGFATVTYGHDLPREFKAVPRGTPDYIAPEVSVVKFVSNFEALFVRERTTPI